jgi:filamentous hemagglutinin family protein
MPQHTPPKPRLFLTGVILALTALQPIIQAASTVPSGGAFTAGAGNISAAGNALTINQSTLHGIIDWNSFSLSKNGVVTFNNGSGATLNRVTGGLPSAILGQLLASGSVYILNPQGVLIGHGATIHTGGDFLASTLNLSNSAFLNNGSLVFSGPSTATVVNLGDLSSTGGSIYLIGHSVQNAGSLNAPKGAIGLAAGSQILISDSAGDQRVFVQAPGGDLTNSGYITAAQVELRSNGGNIYALAGNNGGQIRATGTATRGGHVWLIAENGTAHVSGLISAANANRTGGNIETSGAHVITNAATIKTGKGGNWLLDPDDITINSTLAGTIDASLNGGTNVTEQTTAAGTGGVGDITVASNIAWTSAATLTLSAYRNIAINSGITISNASSGNLSLLADNAATGVGTVNFSGTGKVDFSGSTGNVSINYNPAGAEGVKYTAPTNYASDVMTNNSWSAPLPGSQGYGSVNAQLTAYMLVNNLTDLANVGTNLTGTYGLGTDMNANSLPFTMIGGTFTGLFDGQGHVISNLPISSSAPNVGLFAINGGTIRNVGLFNETVNSTASASGNTGGLAAQNSGIIFASYVNGLINGPNAGGLVGLNSGTVNNSYSAGSVNSGVAPSAGLVFTNSGAILDSYTYANAQTGLVSASPGAVTNSYWDTTDTAATNSAAGNGYTRSTLQIGVPYGFASTYWGGGTFSAPLYPYLLWQFPANTTPVTVNGTAYANQGQTPFTNTPVQGMANGVNFAQTVYTGTSGYYYFLLPASMAPPHSNVITYLPTHGFAASFYDDFQDPDVSTIYDALPITNGYLTMTNKQNSAVFSSMIGDLSNAAASAPNMPFTVTNGILSLHPDTYLDLAGNLYNRISLNQAISTNSLVLEEFLQVTQTAPLAVSNLSLLSAGTYTLTNPSNSISVLATGPARNGIVTSSAVIISPLITIIPLGASGGNLNVFSATNLLLGSTDAASGISSTGTVTIQSSQGLTIANGIQVVSLNQGSAPIPLILADGATFTNLAGSGALQAMNSGTWQVWSQNPANDNRGGEAYAFKQYNAVYGTSTPGQSTGNAFYYTLAPDLTASIGPVSKQYDATTSATGIGSYSLSGAVDGDTVSLLNTPSTGTFADKNVGTGKPITVTGLTVNPASNGAANVYGYSFNSTLVADVGTITPAPLTVSTSAASKVYDGNTLTTGTLGSLSGVFEGDVVSLQGGAAFNFATKNAGAGISVTASGLTLTGADAADYVVIPQIATADITAAQLFYAPVATSRLYGSNNPVFTGTVSGLVGGDTLASVATGSATFTSPATSASDVGTFAIDGSGLTLTGGNYTLAQSAGSSSALTITPAPLTYASSGASRTYGSANPVFTGSVNGLVLGQTLASVATGTPSFTSSATSASNVGVYAITGSGLTLDTGDYTLTQAGGNSSAFSIAPATLSYAATSGITRAYGSGNPTFAGSVTGFVNGETLSSATTGLLLFSSPATVYSAAGNYAINGSGLTANFGNYVFAQAAGNATALTVTAPLVSPPNPTLVPTPTLLNLIVPTAQLVPVILPAPTNSFSSLLAPVNAIGLFQVTFAGIDSSFSSALASLAAPQQPSLAESSIFSSPTDQTSKYFAGAKP